MHLAPSPLLPLPQIELRVCDLAAKQMGLDRSEVHPGLRLIADLHCDSLNMIELIMEIEDSFDIALPGQPAVGAYKAVFTRDQFRLSDLAELVYLQQGSGRKKGRGHRRSEEAVAARQTALFSQLSGRYECRGDESHSIFEAVGKNTLGFPINRRRADGMICVLIPGAEVTLGTFDACAAPDEQPQHRAHLDSFLIDQEPISTTAYCRFLNSIGPVEPSALLDWFVLTPDDDRQEHMLIRQTGKDWFPVPDTDRLPMMLVSWYGAAAYSLWANRCDWNSYRTDAACLPSEAQWEYAARGSAWQKYPWGNLEPGPELMRFAQHSPGHAYTAETLPMAAVNEELGVSPFGLRHMAGNIWQWCSDWYAPDFYATPEASHPNPANRQPTQIRSERGGSWVGPSFLCRSSYRRGRSPAARGRCLGFRCISHPTQLSHVKP